MDTLEIYLPGIVLAYSAFLLSAMSPGPNILAILGTSMSTGRPCGLALALGVATGSLCWATLTVAGLSRLLAAYATALTVIKIAGGCYLLWLAYGAFLAAASAHGLEAKALAGNQRGLAGYYLRGLTVQRTNPKAALAWIAIISLGMGTDAPMWVGASLVAGTFTLSVVIHTLYALAFSTPAMVRLYGKGRRWIQSIFGIFFAFAGLKLLSSRV